MRIILHHKHFVKNYRKRIKSNPFLKKKYEEKLRRFIENPRDLTLKDHSLTGDLQGFRSFSITGEIRVMYYIQDDNCWFYDIGTHNQVY